MKKNIFIICLVFIFSAENNFAQQKNYSYSIHKASEKIILDGVLNEAGWTQADSAKDFFMSLPYDTTFAKTKTVCRMTYDDNFLYVSAECFQEKSSGYIVQSLRRDYSFPASDAFAVVIDPFSDKTNGFNFGVNPYGSQREGLLAGGGAMGVSTDWDDRWFSYVKQENDKWIVEMAIPFTSLRYKENNSTWKINFLRNNYKLNETSSWVPVPKIFNISTLAFTGDLIWDVAPKKPGVNISLIPYIIGGVNEPTAKTFNSTYNTGLDMKIGISSSLNLDLTINPDFSQVEVDRQQTNLTRFSLYYPEKRNFFIENSDLFANFGFSKIRPFFSRNIGFYNGQTIPILAGARLSGKLNKNWRIGVMSLQTKDDTAQNLFGQNYFVAAVQRKIFARSNIGFLFVNRQAFNKSEYLVNDFNRTLGVDYVIASSNNKLTGRILYHHSFQQHQLQNSYTHASYINYSNKHLVAIWNHEYVGENFIADIGFVPHLYNYDAATKTTHRETYWRLEPTISYKFYPRSKLINSFGPEFYSSNYFTGGRLPTDDGMHYTENEYRVRMFFNLQNSAKFDVREEFWYEWLKYSSNIAGAIISPGAYRFTNFYTQFVSNARKKLNTDLIFQYGSFYGGTKLSYSATVNLRVQPVAAFSLAFSEDDVNIPSLNYSTQIYLIGPKLDFSFAKNIYFTTFFQYNTQLDNFNINARFQWRFKPMSDLFIVYTDNYDTLNFGRKTRGLVVKLNYWFSI